MALIQDYLELSDKYQQEYGTHTILLMQVGSFFEVYGNKTHRMIDEFCRICDLNIAEKGAAQMAGFKDFQLEKYLKKIQEVGYTAVVHVQDETKTNRVLGGVFSPGTYFSDSPKLSNHITCIWIDQVQRLFPKGQYVVVGVASIDIFTGSVQLMEYTEEYRNNPTTYDELERFISIVNPSEAILITNIKEIDTIISYAGIQCDLIHRIPIVQEDTAAMKRVRNCEKQTYQKEILSRFGKNMPEHPIATQAFCYLLDFVYQHNPHLVEKLSDPIWEHPNRLVLANHSLKQLNIIDDGSVKSNKYSSISSMLNECMTPMGKRAFLHLLLHPICDPEVLQREYDITEYLLGKTIQLSIKDLAKWERKLFLKKTTFSCFSSLFQDLNTVKHLAPDKVMLTYLHYFDSKVDQVPSYCETIQTFIREHIDLEKESIQTGIDEEYDRQKKALEDAEASLARIQRQWNDILEQKEKKKSDYVKIHETEKSIGLICTKRRAALLHKTIALEFEVQSGNNYYLLNPEIKSLCSTITTLRSTIQKEVDRVFSQIVVKMEAYQSILNTIIVFVTRMDLMYTRASIANKYHYCKPILVEAEKSFVDSKQLRHPLIEQIQTSELYVTNDMALGQTIDGILLYGTNAVGKTSFIRALGISVIMAQAGLFVPCSSFHFKPYRFLFTRILGNDNLFKGMSTFAVEMSELRTILKWSDANSLILGDELCSGTETQSAISIFVAGIQQLSTKRSSFLFATHLHEITEYEEITSIPTLSMKHMAVVYNKEVDALVYDRKLQEGPGNSLYGLEVCKSLQLPQDFIDMAYQIRNKTSPLLLKTSKYNTKHVVGLCELCKRPGAEVHHLEYQQDAKEGWIVKEDFYFPVNHPANLITICEACHDEIHQKKRKMKKVKTMKGASLLSS
jgi:DNA mismatch repair protein MutS